MGLSIVAAYLFCNQPIRIATHLMDVLSVPCQSHLAFIVFDLPAYMAAQVSTVTNDGRSFGTAPLTRMS